MQTHAVNNEKIGRDSIREGMVIEDDVGREMRVVNATASIKSHGIVGCIPVYTEGSDDTVIVQNITFRAIRRIVSRP